MPGKEFEVRPLILHAFSIVTASLVLTACGGTGTLRKTFDNPIYTDSSYSDILVIGVAGDYDNRGAFERVMASRIKAAGATATASYTVFGRQPINRVVVSAAVQSRGFDAVLLTRVISQATDMSLQDGTSETKVSRKEASRAIDLFRYDYEELSDPGDLVISSTVILSVEMFHAADEARMWAIESTISDMENVGQLIDRAADIIMSQLRKGRLIGR